MPEIGAITFGGLMTGLDTKTLISQLVSIARQPIERLQQGRSQEEKRISAFQEFNSKLLALKTASEKLLTATDFFARTGTTSDAAAVDVSVTNTAQVGRYAVAVTQLASAGQRSFVGVADKTAQTLSGTFSIQNAAGNPNSFTISIDANGMSLEQLRDAINNDTNNNGKMVATIIDTGSETNRYILQIRGRETGTVNDFEVTSTASLTLDTNINVTFSASNAIFTINGVSITRSNNVISDVLDGITLTLKSTTISDVTVSVDNDVKAMESKIKDFVNAYNNIISYIQENSKVDLKNPKNNGLFVGDSTVRGIRDRLHRLLTDAVSGLAADFNALNDVGIATGADGKLAIDEDTLSHALATDPDDVSKIFIGSGDVSGVAGRVNSELADFTNPVGGLIDIRVDGTQERITRIDDRIEMLERRLTSYENSLVRQFAALEQLVSTLQSRGSALNGLGVDGSR
jgi:flagellar hook-associated protein 2